MTEVEYVDGSTWHGRTGGLENSFEYKVGFVLLNLEEDTKGPAFFSRRSGKSYRRPYEKIRLFVSLQ